MFGIEFDTSTLMFIVFIFLFLISMWKISPFLQNKVLEDDDTTTASQAELLALIRKHQAHQKLTTKELFIKIKEDPDFDAEHFWRFNENKLHQLLRTQERKN